MTSELKNDFRAVDKSRLKLLPTEAAAENAPEGDAEEHFKLKICQQSAGLLKLAQKVTDRKAVFQARLPQKFQYFLDHDGNRPLPRAAALRIFPNGVFRGGFIKLHENGRSASSAAVMGPPAAGTAVAAAAAPPAGSRLKFRNDPAGNKTHQEQQ